MLTLTLSCAFAVEGESLTTNYSNGRGKVEYDVVREDTVIYSVGDTVEIYTSGLDTTYVTFAEEIPDSLLENGWVINNPYKQMVIELHHQNAPVNNGLIGINLTDFFEPLKAPEGENADYTFAPDPWQAVSDLAPKTVRIFSGANAKFMHPLGSYDPIDDITYGGYGYNWKEMISYFDVTDNAMDAPEITPGVLNYDLIASQLEDLECDGCEIWIDDKLMGRFQDLYVKCLSQPTFDATDTAFDTYPEQPLYINDFARLIEKIETANIGHIVDVIYCVNIESQSTTELLDVIDYLRITKGINLIGLEMGNEVGGKFGEKVMGFENFERYWSYINGDNYDGLMGDYDSDDLDDALASDVQSDHDFLGAIKNNSAYYFLKIGLPAENTPDCGALYDFGLLPPFQEENVGRDIIATIPILTDPDPGVDDADEDCECLYPDWNVELAAKYGELSTYENYLFDAVIFHPYYTTTNSTATCEDNSNWRDIMLQLHPDFVVDDNSDDPITLNYQITDGEWTYSTVDPYLEDIFNQITGIPADDLKPGNFKEFTRDRIDISFTEHANQMLFTDDDEGPETKEIWLTEYNLDDKVILPDGAAAAANEKQFQPFESSVANTFSHAVMLQNWFLYNIKVNYDPDYSPLFLTRATVQNMLGGSKTMIMTNSSESDQDALDEAACGTTQESPFFLRRATYFAAQLWRVINDNDLRYLKTETTMATLNDNVAPTVFIDDDPLDPKLFIIYSNVTDTYQDFYIHPGDVVEIFYETGYQAILDTDIDALILDADRLYSTAGRNTLFDINEDYNDCTNASDNENIFELTELVPYAPNHSCPGAFDIATGVCARNSSR